MGAGVTAGAPYFDGKAQYEQYQSFWDPLKTHTIRLFADDFNQDGKVDLVAEAILWHPTGGRPMPTTAPRRQPFHQDIFHRQHVVQPGIETGAITSGRLPATTTSGRAR